MATYNRREMLAWLARAGVATAAVGAGLAGCSKPASPTAEQPVNIIGQGYGRDPDMLNPKVTWHLTLTADQTAMVNKLADIILPADEGSPAASVIGVPAFVDEWISAPYPEQQDDREVILAGLDWLNEKSGGDFVAAPDTVVLPILDGICDAKTAQNQTAAKFFDRFRRVCMIGYYTSPEGMEDLGYTNSPAASFSGPPQEVLEKMGLV